MKTTVLKQSALIVLAFIVIIITSSRPAHAESADLKLREVTFSQAIHKLSVKGNVEVFLTQGNAENLKVYDDVYSRNAPVNWDNGILSISSNEDHKLSVWITVKNLSEIEASGNSTIRSMNKLSSVDLDIDLKDEAKAEIDARAFSINSNISDSSSLMLSGESENHHMSLKDESVYQADEFTADNRSIFIKDSAEASYQQDGRVTSIKAANALVSERNILFSPNF